MHFRDFRRAGHWPTLFCAFLYFDVSFMVWVLLGALANSIVADLGLSQAAKGFMVALPLLAGALLRLVLGVMADRVGCRRTALLGLGITVAPLLLGWLWADSFSKVLVVGLLLGVAGASFAVALPLASRWYPPQHQGLVMGIAGAGNSGTALATFFGPRLADVWDWHTVFALALIPTLLTWLIFAVFAKDSPTQPPPQPLAEYGRVVGYRDTWWFCLFYSVTFGGFVGLASFLNIFFHDQYHLRPADAGVFTTLAVIAGSFLRPVGGHLADRFGGVRVLTLLFLLVGAVMLAVATLPPLGAAVALLFVGMGFLGMGNGAIFQVVPLRFPREIGVITGVVGAAGGVGGFLLPNFLASLKHLTDSYTGGFLCFALTSLAAAAAIVHAARSWAKPTTPAQSEITLSPAVSGTSSTA
ncbi:MAG: MFS transporter [Gemmataceae bacterium]|nr:MFS transporter [Gemmataceae bacterium]